jgi:hypothetical protein
MSGWSVCHSGEKLMDTLMSCADLKFWSLGLQFAVVGMRGVGEYARFAIGVGKIVLIIPRSLLNIGPLLFHYLGLSRTFHNYSLFLLCTRLLPKWKQVRQALHTSWKKFGVQHHFSKYIPYLSKVSSPSAQVHYLPRP